MTGLDLELAVAMVTVPPKKVDMCRCDCDYDQYYFNSSSNVDAGLTYIGQMISHDIVPSTTKNADSRVVSGLLDLDSLYGELKSKTPDDIPGDDKYFKKGRFKLGCHSQFDLYRINKKAQIPEPRNDENTIIAQLHNVWLRLHNFLLNHGYAKTGIEARKLVCLTFQLIVVEDFLPAILKQKVYQYFFDQQGVDILPHYTGVPQYFSHGSFRFGHSIVRNDYKTDSSHAKRLSSLFRRDTPLTKSFTIDWSLLFNSGNGSSDHQDALAFDTFITPLMSVIPLRSEPAIHIALANLTASRTAGLPTGIEMLNIIANKQNSNSAITLKKITPLTSTKGATFSRFLRKIEQVPLWPYILLEAQCREKGSKLGELGSLLNAQVLRKAMSHAKFSIYDPVVVDPDKKYSFDYKFERVINKMGRLGCDLLSCENRRDVSGNGKLSMHTIIEFIK